MAKLPAPSDLGTRAERLWDALTDGYEFRPDELVVLEDACREMDIIDRLEDELAISPLMVEGSMGQQVASPLVSELRQHRAVVARLLAQLKIPDESGSGATPLSRSDAARRAANARWAKQG